MARAAMTRWAVPLAAGLAIVVTLAAEPAAADPIEDQRQRVEDLTDELERLAEASDILAEDYVMAIDEQRRVDAEVAAAQQRVAAAEAEVAALRDALSVVAVQTFVGAGADGLAPLLDSQAHTERLQRDQLVRVALSTVDATTDELDLAVDQLRDQHRQLDERRATAADAAGEVEAARQDNDARKADFQQARAEAESELGRLIEEEQERRARQSYERMRGGAEDPAEDAAEDDADDATADEVGGANVGTDDDPSSSSPPDVPPASSRAGTAVEAAMSQLGVPYQYAMSTPGVGFDCSGLTAWAWEQAGVELPHQSKAQHGSVASIPIQEARPGDLIFFYSPISHVGMYIGDGQMVNAPNSTTTVKVATVNWEKVTGVGRPG